MSEISKKLLLSMSTFVVLLVIVEVALRTFTPADLLRLRSNSLTRFYEPDSLLVYRMVANTRALMFSAEFQVPVYINEWNIRESRAMHSNSTLRRILFIGDSFTFGTGVEEESTFVRRIERLLNMNTNGNVRCYNGGVQGYSPEQEYYNLIRLWDVIGPEAVCWVFFADDVRLDPREFWPDDSAPSAFERMKVVLRKHLYLYNFFGTRLSALGRTFEPRRGTEGLDPVEAVNLIPWDEHILARWSVTKSYIVKAKEFCDSRSVPFLLVNIPDVSQVDSVRWAEKLSGLGVPIDQTNVQASVDSLSNFAKRNRITIIDLRRTIIRSGGQQLYFPLDHHLTSRGHAAVARTIAEKLLHEYTSVFE